MPHKKYIFYLCSKANLVSKMRIFQKTCSPLHLVVFCWQYFATYLPYLLLMLIQSSNSASGLIFKRLEAEIMVFPRLNSANSLMKENPVE